MKFKGRFQKGGTIPAPALIVLIHGPEYLLTPEQMKRLGQKKRRG